MKFQLFHGNSMHFNQDFNHFGAVIAKKKKITFTGKPTLKTHMQIWVREVKENE